MLEKPPPYRPPPGFEAKSIEEHHASSELFDAGYLKGKEIFYITAPASMDMSTVEMMTLRGVEKRKSVVTHDGNDYAFVEDNAMERGHTNVMIPSSSDDGYRASTLSHLEPL